MTDELETFLSDHKGMDEEKLEPVKEEKGGKN